MLFMHCGIYWVLSTVLSPRLLLSPEYRSGKRLRNFTAGTQSRVARKWLLQDIILRLWGSKEQPRDSLQRESIPQLAPSHLHTRQLCVAVLPPTTTPPPPLPCPTPKLKSETWSETENQGRPWHTSICFLSLRNQNPMLPLVQCLKTVSLYIFFCFIISCFCG